MKLKLFFSFILILLTIYLLPAQDNRDGSENIINSLKKEKIGIVLYSNDPETVWNAFRLANYSISEGDTVSVFLLGKGVEAKDLKSKVFDIKEKMKEFLDAGGQILACGTCLSLRKDKGKNSLCTVSSMSDLYSLIKKSDRILSF